MKGVRCAKRKCIWNRFIIYKEYGLCTLDSIDIDKNGVCEDFEEEEDV